MTVSIFQTNTKAKSAEVNENFAFIAGDRIIAFDSSTGAAFGTFPIGDLTAVTNGSLAGDLNARSGSSLNVYNASGALVGSVSYDDMLNLQDATVSAAGVAALPKRVILSNSTDSDHDIEFTAGNVIASDGSHQILTSAETKQIDATWAAGSGAGGLAEGLTVANNTWYYCFVLSDSDNIFVGYGFDTSSSAANILADTAVVAAGGTQYAYCGSIRTNGSANIREFSQVGNRFRYLNKGTFSQNGDYTTLNYGTSKVDVTLVVPPLEGIISRFIFRPSQIANSADRAFLIRSSSETNTAPTNAGGTPTSSDRFDLHLLSGTSEMELLCEIETNDSKVWYRGEAGTDVNSGIVLITLGWIDTNI